MYMKIVDAAKPTTTVIVFNRLTSSLDDIIKQIAALPSRAFASVGLVQDGTNLMADYRIVEDQAPCALYNLEMEGLPSLTSWSPVITFLQSLQSLTGMATFDFISCLLGANPGFSYAISQISTQLGVVLQASTDMAGNLAQGGNWVQESDAVNIQDVYFTEAIVGYTGLLYLTYSSTKNQMTTQSNARCVSNTQAVLGMTTFGSSTIYAWGMSGNGGISGASGSNFGGSVTGSGYTAIAGNVYAFAALKSDNTIYSWGISTYGGVGAITGSYTAIASNRQAFAALKSDTTIYAWGLSAAGGTGAPTGSGYIAIASNDAAFAALKSNGTITAWGGIGATGAPTGSGYTAIASNFNAFAALTSSGKIYAWGDAGSGGTNGFITGTGYTAIANNYQAFAALKSDGSLYSWGATSMGGAGAPAGTGYTAIIGNWNAFAALNASGSITAWAEPGWGGTSPPVDNYTTIVSNAGAFAALNSSGRVYAWGWANQGGLNGFITGSGYTAIYSSTVAFAALNSSGRIYAWGAANGGISGASGPYIGGFVNGSGYVSVVGNDYGFAALNSSGSIYAWGNSTGGGINGIISGSGYTAIANSAAAFAGIIASPGVITGINTVKYMTSTVLTLTAYDGTSFQWQSSTDNSVWTNIAGQTTVTYSTPAMGYCTRYYRVAVTLGSIVNYSPSFTLIVSDALVVALPTDIKPWVWVDAADTTSYATSGTTVLSVVNKGTGNAGTTVTGTISVGTDNINGRPTFVFPNTAQITTTQTTTVKPYALFFVTHIGSFVAGNYTSPFVTGINGIAGGIDSTSMTWGASSIANTIGTPTTFANTTRVCAVVNSLASTANNYITINGTAQALTPYNVVAGSIPGERTWYISPNTTFTASAVGATYAEVLVYNAEMTVTQRQGIEGYLAWKWGLQASLPATHPYSTANMSATLALYNRPRMFVTSLAAPSPAWLFPTAIVKNTSTGDFYVAGWSEHVVRKITPAGVISIFAGATSTLGQTDAIGSLARFNYPTGIAIDNTNTYLYVAETGNQRIRRIEISTRTVSTLAGPTGTTITPGSADGTGVNARFNNPYSITVEPLTNNIYVADTVNNKIRKITPAGVVTSPYGSLTAGFADGVGTSATFTGMRCVGFDNSGILYVTTATGIRKIDMVTGMVTTFVGPSSAATADVDGVGGDARFLNPSAMTFDSLNNIYVAGYNNNKISKVTPAGVVSVFAGPASGTTTAALTNGVDCLSKFSAPFGILMSGSDFYVTDAGNAAIRKISNSTLYQVGTFATGMGNTLGIVSNNSGDMFICTESFTIAKVTSTGVVSVLAGDGSVGFNDEIGISAIFNKPYGIAKDSVGNLYVSDSLNHSIRKITPAGRVITIAGRAPITVTSGFLDATGTASRFNTPKGIVIDSNDNLFVADTGNNRIRKITPLGVVTTFFGNGTATETSTTINAPLGLAIDALNNLYVTTAGNNIRKFSSAAVETAMTFTVAGGAAATFSTPGGIVVDRTGILYVLDTISGARYIRKITTANVVSTIAGGTGVPTAGTATVVTGSVTATNADAIVGTDARFSTTASGLHLDGNGNLYVGDTGNGRLRIVTINSPPTGIVSITGTLTQGQTLTANTSNLADADVLGAFSYAWWQAETADGSYTSTGITTSTLVLTQDHVDKYIRVIVSYTDGRGAAESVTTTTVSTILNVDDAGSGLAIAGTLIVGSTLVANTDSLSDPDGINSGYTYQWSSSATTSGFSSIGATSSYTLTGTELNKYIRLTVSYTNSSGQADSTATTTATTTAAGPNISGSLSITGTLTESYRLTADITAVTDADGIPGVITYTWATLLSGIYSTVQTSNSNSYVIVAADINKSIKLTISYTDSTGVNESMYIANTDTITALPASAAYIGTAGITNKTLSSATNSSALQITYTGDGNKQWQSSPDNTNWTLISGATSTAYTATNVLTSTYYRVKITYNTNVYLYSNSLLLAVAPSMPTISSVVAGDGTAVVTWSSSTSYSSSAVTYTVLSNGGQTVSASGTTATVSGLIPGQSYTFTVAAYNGLLTTTSASSASVAVYANPSSPTSVTYVAGDGQVTVAFAAPYVTGGSDTLNYFLYPNVEGTGTTFYTATPTVSNGRVSFSVALTNGTAYTLYLIARNSVDGTKFSSVSIGAAFTPTQTLVTGSIPQGNMTIGYGQKAMLTLTGSTGNTFLWQKASTASPNTWNTATNTTTTYKTLGLTVSTYFRVRVNTTQFTDAILVTVNPTSDFNNIVATGAGATVGYDSNTATILTSAAKGTNEVVNWIYSTDGIMFSIVPNSKGVNSISVSNLTETTSYRVCVANGMSPIQKSPPFTITVNDASVSGYLIGAATVVQDTASTDIMPIILMGEGTGTVSWQSSTDNANWVSATSLQDLSVPDQLNAPANADHTIYYRAGVKNGGSATAYTKSVSITVVPAAVGTILATFDTAISDAKSTTIANYIAATTQKSILELYTDLKCAFKNYTDATERGYAEAGSLNGLLSRCPTGQFTIAQADYRQFTNALTTTDSRLTALDTVVLLPGFSNKSGDYPIENILSQSAANSYIQIEIPCTYTLNLTYNNKIVGVLTAILVTTGSVIEKVIQLDGITLSPGDSIVYDTGKKLQLCGIGSAQIINISNTIGTYTASGYIGSAFISVQFTNTTLTSPTYSVTAGTLPTGFALSGAGLLTFGAVPFTTPLTTASSAQVTITAAEAAPSTNTHTITVTFAIVEAPSGVACFVKGTHVLTQNGYKAVETLLTNDYIVTADKRIVDFKLHTTTLATTVKETAPYVIHPHAFGSNIPSSPLRLSPNHKILIAKGLWISPREAARTNPRVEQYGVGDPITYYHIQCANYLADNLIAGGMIVESYGDLHSVWGLQTPYTWNERMNGFTRISPATLTIKVGKAVSKICNDKKNEIV